MQDSRDSDDRRVLRNRVEALTAAQRADLRRWVSADKTSGYSLVAEALHRCGVKHVTGIAGTPVDRIFPECLSRGMRLIGTRHQQAAVLMAASANYIAGRLESVAVVSAGPAVTNALTGVLVARDNGWPVIVMGGRRPLHSQGIGYFQELDAVPIYQSVTKWAAKVEQASEIMSTVVRAYEIACSGRPGPVYLDLPEDVLDGTGELHSSLSPAIAPLQKAAAHVVLEAAHLITNAKRPLFIFGEGIRWSFPRGSLQRMVEGSGIPFITTPMARGVLSDEHMFCANEVRRWVQSQADVILMAGASFDWRFRFGAELAPGVCIIHVDADPLVLGKNVKAALTVCVDSGSFVVQLEEALAGLPAMLRTVQLTSWHELVKAKIDESRRLRLAWRSKESTPMSPQQLFVTLRDFLPCDAVVVLDGNITLSTGQLLLSAQEPFCWLDPGWNGCMGSGIPFGMGAKLAAPDRMVVVICGDYGFGLSAMDMETAVRHGIPFIVIVVNNDGSMGALRQKMFFPPDYPELFSRFLPRLRYERIMEVFGGHAECVAEPADIRPALERAAASGLPSCINVSVDPETPIPGVW